ncbi:MAG: STM4012 family radical SAM protein [Planctomycetes bacterium]|nr:STM4012 family radical SAM protein [Planctomycetota bacterium]
MAKPSSIEAQPARRASATTLDELRAGSPYVSYSYSYPHKTSYRPLEPRALKDVWATEERDAVFLYLHIPFCAVRCGFCNLLATKGADGDLTRQYIDTLARHARAAREAIGDRQVVRVALGGGTPTFLDPAELDRVFGVVRDVMGADTSTVPVGIEVSPETVTPERLQVLREHGVDRVSIGVQSFDQSEAGRMGRPQRDGDVHRALRLIREFGFPTLNIDLIYGGDGQDEASWRRSLEAALEYRPEELYLYPLYVRPLTGLGRHGISWDEHRLALYRAGRDQLLGRGYRQVSMRMFRAPHAKAQDGPVYCCQQDGMVGLGAGARSYTSALHYSTEYAVGRDSVRGIIQAYIDQDDAALRLLRHGIELDDDERKRRYLIQSLLQADGLARGDYSRLFGGDALEHFPQLQSLVAHGLAVEAPEQLVLTPGGLELSDAIGPWLYSERVGRRMQEYAWA